MFLLGHTCPDQMNVLAWDPREDFNLVRYARATRVDPDRRAMWRYHLDRSRSTQTPTALRNFHVSQERALRASSKPADAPEWVKAVWRELATATRRRTREERAARAAGFNLRKK